MLKKDSLSFFVTALARAKGATKEDNCHQKGNNYVSKNTFITF